MLDELKRNFQFFKELEAVEENYRKEIDDLWKMVKSLQAENRQLSSSVKENASNILSSGNSAFST